jgi:hypothetical protein
MNMKGFFKLGRWFFPDKVKDTKEQESLVERALLLSRMYPGFAVAICPGCFMKIDSQNEIPTPNQQNRNNEALKSAQKILEENYKNSSPTVNANRNEMRQPIENSQTESVSAQESRTNVELIETRQMEKSVPASENRTSIDPTTTRQQTRREKFSETAPKAFTPPELIRGQMYF